MQSTAKVIMPPVQKNKKWAVKTAKARRCAGPEERRKA
jgi:hypothetical protein